LHHFDKTLNQENHYKLETDAWEKYKLPVLSKKDKMLLELGERVQMQYREGRIGRGMVVVDVAAPMEEVYETLSLFDR
jgi:hypothetical protein